MAFKGEQDLTGVQATWIIGEPAARAVEVLHRLQRPEPRCCSVRAATMPNKDINMMLNGLVTWINRYCNTRGRADGIPDVDGHTWKLFSSQFRRTLAWHIARRHGGAIAGAIQYRHLSVQIFEDYANSQECHGDGLARGSRLDARPGPGP